MIYLIDDNLNNQQQLEYHANYLFDGTFDDILKCVYKIKIDEFSLIKEDLKNATTILLHNTFSDADNNGHFIKGETSKRIRNGIVEDIIKKFEIPYVLFSRGIYETTFDDKKSINAIYGIHKDVFYKNLFYFLHFYQKNKIIDLRILVDGENYEIQEKIDFLDVFIEKINREQSILTISNESKNEFELFYISIGSEKNFTDFWNQIANQDISLFQDTLKKIKKSLKKYGRNIYN